MSDDYRKRQNDEFLEETAAETAPNDIRRDEKAGAGNDQAQQGRGYGIFAVALSILAFFFLPVPLGAAGIIVGFIARARGANTFGGWAIGLGIAAIVIRLFAIPFL